MALRHRSSADGDIVGLKARTVKNVADDPYSMTSAASAYAEIKKRILNSEYGAGTTVSVQDLSQLLSMSRTPIRDALIRLEKEGLVELAPRQGFRVLPLSPQDMLEVYQMLAGLESVAIHILIERGLDYEAAARLLSPVLAMEAALDRQDLDSWAAADAAFHRALVDLTRNARLSQTVDQFYDQTIRARLLTLRLRPLPAQSTCSHRRLAEAIIARNMAEAQSIHMEQRNRSGRELVEILARLNIRHL
jgi:DNA-binding GntR family transcriptional regulator